MTVRRDRTGRTGHGIPTVIQIFIYSCFQPCVSPCLPGFGNSESELLCLSVDTSVGPSFQQVAKASKILPSVFSLPKWVQISLSTVSLLSLLGFVLILMRLLDRVASTLLLTYHVNRNLRDFLHIFLRNEQQRILFVGRFFLMLYLFFSFEWKYLYFRSNTYLLTC